MRGDWLLGQARAMASNSHHTQDPLDGLSGEGQYFGWNPPQVHVLRALIVELFGKAMKPPEGPC